MSDRPAQLINIVAQLNADGSMHVWHQLAGAVDRQDNAGVLYSNRQQGLTGITLAASLLKQPTNQE